MNQQKSRRVGTAVGFVSGRSGVPGRCAGYASLMATKCAVANAPSSAAVGVRSGNRINAGDRDYDSDACAKLSLVLAENSIGRNEKCYE
jgi:hypothetical protein